MKYLKLNVTVLVFLLSMQVEAKEIRNKTDLEIIALCDVNGDKKINTGKEYRAGKISKGIVKKERNCSLDIRSKEAKEGLKEAKEGLKEANEGLKEANEGLKKSKDKGKKLDKDIKELEEAIMRKTSREN